MIPLACLLLSGSMALSAGPQSDTTYLPSIGSRFFVKPSAQFRQYFLLRIESARDAQKAIQFISESASSGMPMFTTMKDLLLRQVDGCDYARDNCYLLFSPRTYDQVLGRPFTLGGNADLIFPVQSVAQPERDGYSFVRVLIIPKGARDLRIFVRNQLFDSKPAVYQGAPGG